MSDEAKLCALVSEAVYYPDKDEQIQFRPFGVTLQKVERIVHPDQDDGLQQAGAVYVDIHKVHGGNRFVVIAFKGTDGPRDLLPDGQIFRGDDDSRINSEPIRRVRSHDRLDLDLGSLIRKHGGFDGKQVFITGHSLGGTRALNFGLNLARQGLVSIHAFNPGCKFQMESLTQWLVMRDLTRASTGRKNIIVHHMHGDIISSGTFDKYEAEVIVYDTFSFLSVARPHRIVNFTGDNPFQPPY